MWRRRMVLLSRALLDAPSSSFVGIGCRSISINSKSFPTSIVVSAKTAEEVALRSEKIAYMPSDVESALAAAAGEFSHKDVKRKALALTDKLKHMSRTKHRGGVHPNFQDQLQRTTNSSNNNDLMDVVKPSRGKARQLEHHSLLQLTKAGSIAVEEGKLEDLSDEKLDAYLDTSTLPQFLAPNSNNSNSSQQNALYNHSSAVAYTASRMPACYAAIQKVLREISRFKPQDWRPASVLDYGSGPGTASWAIRDIFRDPRYNSHRNVIRVYAVEPNPSMAAIGQAIYNELEQIKPDKNEAPHAYLEMRWMNKIGSQFRMHPKQHELVVAAYVLSEIEDKKQQQKLIKELWERTDPINGLLVLIEPGTPSGFDNIARARSLILSTASKDDTTPFHIVAPCPHEGACPLVERQSWCHFVQRYQRPDVQRAVKVGRGGKAARTYQDERFSYVVFAKGVARGSILSEAAGKVQVDVSGIDVFSVMEYSEDQMEIQKQYLSVPEDLKPKKLGAGYDDDDFSDDDEDATSLDTTNNNNYMLSNAVAYESDTEDEELKAIDYDVWAEEVDALTLKYMMESINANSKEDGDDTSNTKLEFADARQKALRVSSFLEYDEMNPKITITATQDKTARKKKPKPIVVGEGGRLAEEAALASSHNWSRILRMPRKRSGHVVLDVCSAVDENGKYDGTKGGGYLLRQVVSKGNSIKATGGRAPYKLARKALWGDVYPLSYQKRIKATEPSGGLTFDD